MEPEIRAEQLAALTRRLKEAGDKGLQKELRKGIANALKPLRSKLPLSARNTLPKRGRLNERVAKSKFSISRKATSRESGLRLVAKNDYSIGRMDEGQLRHLVFYRGRGKKVWVRQTIDRGWASKPFDEELPVAREEIEAAMMRVIRMIEGGSSGAS